VEGIIFLNKVMINFYTLGLVVKDWV